MTRVIEEGKNCDHGWWNTGDGNKVTIAGKFESMTNVRADDANFTMTFTPHNSADRGGHDVDGTITVDYEMKPWLNALGKEGYLLGGLMDDPHVPYSSGIIGAIQKAERALCGLIFKKVYGQKDGSAQVLHATIASYSQKFSSKENNRRLRESRSARTIASLLFQGHLAGFRRLNEETDMAFFSWVLDGTDEVKKDVRGARDWAVRVQAVYSTMSESQKEQALALFNSHPNKQKAIELLQGQKSIEIPFSEEDLLFPNNMDVGSKETIDVFQLHGFLAEAGERFTTVIADTTYERLSRAMKDYLTAAEPVTCT